MQPRELKVGDVVQLAPFTVRNPLFAGCMLVVTEAKDFGAQGYVQMTGENGKPGGRAFYRPTFEETAFVGLAYWVAK